MLLTIDAGNTRTKWAIFDRNGEITSHGACVNHQLSGIHFNPASPDYERVIISNVAGAAHATAISDALRSCRLPIHWVTSTAKACGVTNQYEVPDTLGTDRWAALIAAWHHAKAPCIVVNAGTAVTIDALDQIKTAPSTQGAFIGGMIMPGLNLMRQSLGLAASQLPILSAESSPMRPAMAGTLPKNTTEAIFHGTLQAITGAVLQMSSALQRRCGKTGPIILSGGDAAMLKNHLECAMEQAFEEPSIALIEDLVLRGLYLIDQQPSQTFKEAP
ncbi:MAG: type III pantothenate kinase [Betaproteobacteria bacterium]|nr:type III pantothenate kinase [Betaproteobacteria bacterium]